MDQKDLTQEQVAACLAILEDVLTEDRRNAVVCALVGHSLITNYCFGEYTCSRCGAWVGDTLTRDFPEAKLTVIVGHDCEMCRENYEKLDWRHKLYAPDPFANEEE